MVTLYVTYRVKDDFVTETKAIVAKFLTGIGEHEPITRYEAFQHADDPTRFMHLMSFSTEDARDAHANAPYTAEFVKALYPVCLEEPTFYAVNEVSSSSASLV